MLMQILAGAAGSIGFAILYNVRGLSAVRVTAFKLFESMRRQHMGDSESEFASLTEAPLLLIDDLGTEPMMRNITVEYLFLLLNERAAAKRHTVIALAFTVFFGGGWPEGLAAGAVGGLLFLAISTIAASSGRVSARGRSWVGSCPMWTCASPTRRTRRTCSAFRRPIPTSRAANSTATATSTWRAG